MHQANLFGLKKSTYYPWKYEPYMGHDQGYTTVYLGAIRICHVFTILRTFRSIKSQPLSVKSRVYLFLAYVD
jgi:hypothetical protein